MDRRLPSIVAGSMLLALSTAAEAQCENMRVIVRNSVYPIVGLEPFCTEFNKMKADLAGMRGELAVARERNRALEARLAAVEGASRPEAPVRVASESARGEPKR